MIQVLYIAGDSRSGSTILDLLLGRHQGFVSTGEIRHIWERGFLRNELCGCHRPFCECNFWRHISDLSGIGKADARQLSLELYSATRLRAVPKIMLGWATGQLSKQYEVHQHQLYRLYRAIKQASGARIIIDSSKNPSYALLLNSVPGIKVSLVHLVRDSRAVAFSWQRRKRRPEVHWTPEHMPQWSLAHSARSWLVTNLALECYARTFPNYIRVRYEDFVTAPTQQLTRIAELVGEVLLDHKPNGPSHTVSGNPARFQSEDIVLCPDIEWKDRMAPSAKRIVTCLTLPFLMRYGYLNLSSSRY